MDHKKPTVQFNQSAEEIMNGIKAKGRPVGGARPVRIPPLDAAPLDGGGTMETQARTLSDPRSPMNPSYKPDLTPVFPRAQAPLPQQGTEEPYRPQLSKESIEGLDALQKFQKEAEAVQAKAVQESSAAIPEENSGKIDEIRSLFADDAQFSKLNNRERRAAIEARLKPLDIADILIHGEIRQDVDVIPGKVSVLLRTIAGEEDLAVKQLMSGESGMDRYLLDKFSLMGLTLGVVSINGTMLPSHLNEKKRFDKELFNSKFDTLMRFPMTLLGDLGLQYYWFEQRVQSLFVDQTSALKNS